MLEIQQGAGLFLAPFPLFCWERVDIYARYIAHFYLKLFIPAIQKVKIVLAGMLANLVFQDGCIIEDRLSGSWRTFQVCCCLISACSKPMHDGGPQVRPHFLQRAQAVCSDLARQVPISLSSKTLWSEASPPSHMSHVAKRYQGRVDWSQEFCWYRLHELLRGA